MGLDPSSPTEQRETLSKSMTPLGLSFLSCKMGMMLHQCYGRIILSNIHKQMAPTGCFIILSDTGVHLDPEPWG